MATIKDYSQAVSLANSHKRLFQYTRFEALEKIIGNKSLRLTRLDKVNDITENCQLIELWKKKIYVSCFTHREYESLFFWNAYSKGQSDGVMFSIERKYLSKLPIYTDEKCINDELNFCNKSSIDSPYSDEVSGLTWGIYDYSCIDIEYCDRKTNDDDDENFVGRKKYIEWDMEYESRLRVAIRPKILEVYADGNKLSYHKPKNEYLYAKLPKACLESLRIVLSPFAEKDLKERVIRLLKDNNLYENVSIFESVLTHEIQ